ncbi:metallophosphoesterase [Phocaeicola sp.]|jgi:predicted MPP superfamily phosphohydrolase
MKKQFLFLFLTVAFLSSCATATLSEYPGVGRVKQYDFYSYDVPPAFDGFRLGFASDFHYESRFKRSTLDNAVRALKSMHADALLLGGDYGSKQGGDLDTLFTALSRVFTPYGTFAVMGNHDYDYCYSEAKGAMEKTNVRLMEHKSYKLMKDGQHIIISGVRNPFDLKRNGDSPSQHLPADDFVVLLTHTPDYAEDTNVSNANLVLAGHTHGGQVSLFKKYSPVKHSVYGNRFLTGWKENSKGTPVIITNGLGTSRVNVRLFTPSEVVLVVLHRVEKKEK